MNNTKSNPYFSIHLTSPNKPFQWCVAINGEVIHHISNIIDFSKNIGYPDLHHKVINNKVDLSDDVDNIDHDYVSDNCFQNQIAVYLLEHCEKFKNEYSAFYANIIKECNAGKANGIARCENCYLTKIANQSK